MQLLISFTLYFLKEEYKKKKKLRDYLMEEHKTNIS